MGEINSDDPDLGQDHVTRSERGDMRTRRRRQTDGGRGGCDREVKQEGGATESKQR